MNDVRVHPEASPDTPAGHRRAWWTGLLALTAASVVAIAFGLRGPESDGSPAEPARVTVVDFAFEAGRLRVPVGTEVTWTQDDTFDHSVVSDDGSFRSDALPRGATFTHRFDAAGTFTYHCGIHPSMTGTVVVSG